MVSARRQRIAIGTLFFVNGGAFGSWAARIPEIADRVDIDISGLGLTLVLAGIGGLAGTRPAGALIDRFGGRSAAVGGSIAVSALLPLIGFATTPVALGLGLFFIGFADVPADLGMNALAMDPKGYSSSFINRFHGLWSVGTFAGGGVATVAAGAQISLPVHFIVIGVVLTISAFLVRNNTTNTRPEPQPTTDRVRGVSKSLVILAGLGFFAALLEGPGSDWSATLLAEVRDAQPAVAALGFVAFSVGMTIARLAGDALVSRIGRHRSYLASLAVTLIGWLLATLFSSVAVTVTGLGLAGLGIGILFPQLYAAGASGGSVSPGRGLAAMSIGARFGFLISAPLIGLLGSTWRLDTALIAVVALAVAGSFALIRSAHL